ncbi:MAG: hypothetical protein ACXVQ7_07560 [Actinomycetota bacterium]
MKRRTFDTLMSMGGVVLTVALLLAGIGAFVGYSFANNNVTKQLSQQQIVFPPKGPAIADPRIAPYLTKYAGQKLTTGAQAEAYADHFIAVHLEDQGKGTSYEGKSYAQLGTVQSGLRTQIAALPATEANEATLAGLQKQLDAVSAVRDTVLTGETLRGLLLNAYAWWQVGQIGLWAAIACFVLAGVMALLAILGFVHRRKASPEDEILAPATDIRRTA